MGILRFNTLVGTVLLSVVAGVALWLQFTLVVEDVSLFGIRRSMRQHQGIFNLLVLLALFVTVVVLICEVVVANDFATVPETTDELRGFDVTIGPIELPPEFGPPIETKRTFLGVPAQYKLEEVVAQDVYLSIIFGIMHGNLFVLFLLPLPICYATQSYLVRLFPVARHVLPENSVGVHRLLGQLLLAGLCFS